MSEENNTPKTEEIESAVEILVAAGVPPAALRDRLNALEPDYSPAFPVSEPDLDRRAHRALRRGRESKRKPNPTEEAIKILTRVGLDPDAIRGELREVQATAIPFSRRPPPVVYPSIDTSKIQAMPGVDFEASAIDQAIATLAVEGIDSEQIDKFIENHAAEIRAKAKKIGNRAYADTSQQEGIHSRLSKTTAEMKSWLLAEMSEDDQVEMSKDDRDRI